jgi:2-C-methyl-D-erythritol 4-phosphate cytidylyltransferase
VPGSYSGAVPRAAVVVLAGGSGSRVGAGVNKVYLPLAGRRIVSWSLRSASRVPDAASLVLVVRPDDLALAQDVLGGEAAGLGVVTVLGGATRHESEDAALAHLAPHVEAGEIDVIAVHDAARPFAGPSLFRSVVEVADALGGAVPTLPALGVTAVGDDGQSRPGGPTAGRIGAFGAARPGSSSSRLARVQTPQAFRAKDLLAAYTAAHAEGYQGTDTASSVEAFSDLPVHTVPGSPLNVKVTYPRDLLVAEHLLAAHPRLLTWGPTS